MTTRAQLFVIASLNLHAAASAFHASSCNARRQSIQHCVLTAAAQDHNKEEINANPPVTVAGVIAPLSYYYNYTYPSLSLHFPDLSKKQNAETVSSTSSSENNMEEFVFLVDTGANVNSIQADLVEKYKIPPLADSIILQGEKLQSEPIGAAGMGGSFDPGTMVILGNCSLAGMPQGQEGIVFLRNLVAAALPRASPAGTAGLLGTAFLRCFTGVEFDWYGTDGDPPTFGFYFGNNDTALPEQITKGMERVPLRELMGLLILTVQVNGEEIPVLVDTGSPITVLNQKTAKQLGIATVPVTAAAAAAALPQTHQQQIGDNLLKVGGIDGRAVDLQRSESASVQIYVSGVSLGEGPVYVGNIPAFKVLETMIQQNIIPDGMSSTSEAPVAILGLDFLKRAYRMIVSNYGPSWELWLEELDETKPVYDPLD